MKSNSANQSRPSMFIANDITSILALIKELQDAQDKESADLFNNNFSEDVLWGTPFGAVVNGYESIHAIHKRMFAGNGNSKIKIRYENDYIRFLSATMAIAYVRKIILPEDKKTGHFNELALFVFAKKEDQWWIVAAQHVPDRRDVYTKNSTALNS